MDNRYEEALEKAKELYLKSKGTIARNILEEIFPQLKESEDERIRKALTEFLKSASGGFLDTAIQCKTFGKWLAWLEKQDYTFEIKEGHWYKCVCDYMFNGTDLMFKNDRLYYCRRDWRLRGEIDERNVKDIGVHGYKSFFRPATNQEIKDWLEKQGEKPQGKSALESINEEKVDNANKVEPKFKVGDTMRTLQEAADNIISGLPVVISIDKEYYHCTNELIAIKDQDDYEYPPMNRGPKTTDNVEPKFKVGNWYQCTKNFFGKGVTFDKDTAYYCAEEGCLQDEYGCHIAIVKDLYDNFRLWDISDAKEGDVLATEDTVFIFKHIDKAGLSFCKSYCEVIGNSKLGFGFDFSINGVCPATKEQRDKFEKAMAEAGYTFDFKKKDLRKLKFRVGDEVITENERSLTITKIDEEGYWSNDLFICDFDSECNWNLVEQKPNDIVEPKFKVGNYVVDNCGYIWRIEGIINQFYILEGIDGGESRPTIEWVNKTFHLWDIIKDAKDGDVLAFKNNVGGIIICKSPTYYDTRSYCRLLIDGNFINEEESGWNSTLLIPASKEQRDKLEKAMAKSGYEFDFRKKELEEIEQNPEYAQLTEFEEAVKDMMNVYRDAIGDSDATTEEVKEHSAYLQSLIPQTPAWSEEDEKIGKELMDFCIKCSQGHTIVNSQDDFRRWTTWLKSIKPKQQ